MQRIETITRQLLWRKIDGGEKAPENVGGAFLRKGSMEVPAAQFFFARLADTLEACSR